MIIEFMLIFAVFLVGLIGLIISKNIFRTIVCLNIMQTAIIVLFIVAASATGEVAPIVEGLVVDPLPQALMITAVVIGASITAMALMFSVKIFHYYGTLDWELIFKDDA